MRETKRHLPIQLLLEWAFRNECAQLELPDLRAPEERGFGFGMEYVLIQRGKLGGVQIDGGGPKLKDSHEDAEAVAAIVSNMPDHLGGRRMAICLAQLARSGITPDWMPGEVPKIEPVEWVSRKKQRQGLSELKGYWVENFEVPHPKNKSRMVRRTKRHEIWWTPCTWVVEPRTIAAAREEYVEWWEALAYVREMLIESGMLRQHAITDAMPPRKPWATRAGGSQTPAIEQIGSPAR